MNIASLADVLIFRFAVAGSTIALFGHERDDALRLSRFEVSVSGKFAQRQYRSKRFV